MPTYFPVPDDPVGDVFDDDVRSRLTKQLVRTRREMQQIAPENTAHIFLVPEARSVFLPPA